MYKIIICLSLLVLSVFADMIGLEKCKHIDAPLPISFTNSLCPSNPCTVKNGGIVETTTKFKTSSSNTLTLNMDAYMGDLKIPLEFVPADEKDACRKLSSGKCPVKDNGEVTHFSKLPINAPFQKVTISLEGYITDDNKKPLFCYRSTVTVEGDPKQIF